MARIVKTTVEIEGRTEERYTLVEESALPAWPDELRTVGQRVPRLEGAEKVSGAAAYTSDVALPGQLTALVLRSPYPRARIRRIDVSRAQAAPGVHAVLTHENAPAIEWDPGIKLLDRELYFHGDEVAVVAAESEATAGDALRLIEVEYEPLPFIVDAETAADQTVESAASSGQEAISREEPRVRGDIERAFGSAAVTVQAVYRTSPAAHNALEPHGAIAWWQPAFARAEEARLTVYESTQGIFAVRKQLSTWLGLPANRINVVTAHMGGGFGAKQEAGKHTLLAALLSRQTGRPVRLMLDRTGENLATGYRAETVQHVRLAADPTGHLTAIDAAVTVGIGAYRADPMMVDGPYREYYACPNVRTQITSVRTNVGPSAAFRAPGYVEATFGLESALDELAARLRLDPLELRRQNYATMDPERGLPYSAKHLEECYRLGAELIGWEGRGQLPQEPTYRRGMGMATIVWGGGGAPPAYALVNVHADGSVDVVTGAQDIGTGTRTAFGVIAAEELGVPLGWVNVQLGASDPGLFAPTSAGSMTLSSVGPAVRAAAADASRQLLEIAGELLDAAPEELRIVDGWIMNPARPHQRITTREIADRVGDFVIVGRGARGPNPRGVMLRTFAAQFAQVGVDMVTGRVHVERIVSVHDVGRVVNPLTAESQVIGGVIQGIGYATMERQVRDQPTGRVLNPNLEEYRVPTVLDVPEIIVRFLDRPDPTANAIGAKGLGEPPIIGVAAAIANAVAAATGVRIRELPLAPNVVLPALTQRR